MRQASIKSGTEAHGFDSNTMMAFNGDVNGSISNKKRAFKLALCINHLALVLKMKLVLMAIFYALVKVVTSNSKKALCVNSTNV